MSNSETGFFVTGGTVPPDAPSYVERQADKDILSALLTGEYCYVLNTRQMGKSSLSARTISRLQQHDVTTVFLDLTRFGGQNVTVDQWYLGLLAETGRSLGLRKEFIAYAKENGEYSPLQRFFGALEHIALPQRTNPIVFFIDEIDAIRSLPFPTDEFFAAIRACYNRRVAEPEFKRLVFCLLGVATPTDLIADTRISPFNIGKRIRLRDFTPEEASPLARGIPSGRVGLERALYWTAGHPYLTQRLCRAIVEQGNAGTPADIDRLCESLFLTKSAQESDDNISFVRNRLLRSDADLASLLDLYRKIRSGKRIPDDETNPLCDVLRLSGVVKVNDANLLVTRNRIYDHVFDDAWVTTHLPGAEIRRQKEAYRRGLLRATTIAGFVAAGFGVLSFVAVGKANEAREQRWRAQGSEQEAIRQAQRANGEKERANEETIRANTLAKRANGEAARASLLAKRASAEAKRANLGESAAKRATLAMTKAAEAEKQAKQFALHLAAARQAALADARKQERLAIAAGMSEREARQRGEQLLYDSNLQLAASLWDNERGGARAIRDLLLTAVPSGKSPDRREFAWRNQWNMLSIGEAIFRLPALFADQPQNEVSSQGGSLASGGTSFTVRLDLKKTAYTGGAGDSEMDLRKILPGIKKAVVAPGGKWIAASDANGKVVVIDAQTGQVRWQQTAHRRSLNRLFFTDAGRTLYSSDEGDSTGSDPPSTVHFWETATGREITPVSYQQTALLRALNHTPGSPLVVSNDGRYHSYQVNKGGIVLLDSEATAGSIYSNFTPESGLPLFCAAFSPDNRLLATGDEGGRLLFWSVTLGKPVAIREAGNIPAHATMVSACLFSRDGKTIATGGEDGMVNLWDVRTRQRIRSFKGHVARISHLSFSEDGQHLWSGDYTGEMRCWNVAEPASTGFFVPYASRFGGMTISPDGRLLLTVGMNSVLLRDALTGQRLRWLDTFGIMTAGAFSPDSRQIAISNSLGEIYVFDARSGERVRLIETRKLGDYRADIGRIAFSPDGAKMAIGFGQSLWNVTDGDGMVQIRETATGKLLNTLTGFRSATPGIAFSPDGKRLAVGSLDHSLSLFDAASGRRLEKRDMGAPLNCLVYSADGKYLAVANDRFIDVFPGGAITGDFRRFTGHANAIHDLAFSPDGRTIASASWDRTAKLWDTQTGRELTTLTGHTERVHRVAFSPDGKRLYSGQLNGFIRLWEASDPGPMARSQRLIADQQEMRWKDWEEEATRQERAEQWDKSVVTIARLVEDMGMNASPGLRRRLLQAKAHTGGVPLGPELLKSANWTHYHNRGVTASMKRADEATLCVVTQNGTKDPWDVQLLQNRLDFIPGRVYVLQFRARIDGVASLPINVQAQKDFGNYASLGFSQPLLGTSEWKTFRYVFSVQNPTPGHSSIVFFLGRQPNTCYIADISLREALDDTSGAH